MDDQQNKIVEREQLYEQIWSKPMTKLATDYGLSDNGLRKICKKLNIPMPKAGHWQKVQHGKTPKRPVLPPFDGPRETTVEIKEKKVAEVPNDPPEILAEYLPKNRIKVSATLEKPHRLVLSLKSNLGESYQYPGMMMADRNNLDVRIGKASVSRALRILDALIKALENRNMHVIIESEYKYLTKVRYLGKTVQFNLYEKTKVKLKEKDKYGYAGRDFIPTGELVLQLERTSYGPKCQDGKNKKLEDSLNDFIIKIYRDVFRQKFWDAEREREQKEGEERERREEELRRKQEIELKKIQILEQSASNWQKSRIIQSYLEASKKAYIEKNGEIKPDSEFQQWVTWANQHADRLDPLKGKEPQTLNIKIEDVDDLA